MAIIGKNVIENLTTAMYEDLKIIYREYIQNSADSIDHAVKEKIIEARDARIEINIEANKRYICIKDNGTGIQADKFEKIMSRRLKCQNFHAVFANLYGFTAFADWHFGTFCSVSQCFSSFSIWDNK